MRHAASPPVFGDRAVDERERIRASDGGNLASAVSEDRAVDQCRRGVVAVHAAFEVAPDRAAAQRHAGIAAVETSTVCFVIGQGSIQGEDAIYEG